MSETKDRLIWCWDADAKMIDVFRLTKGRYTGKYRLNRVAYFYTADFEDVQAIAEDFVKRYDEMQ